MVEVNKTTLYDEIASDDVNERLVDGQVIVSDDNVETVVTVNSSGVLESKKGTDTKKTYATTGGGLDTTAIHVDTENEIHQIAEKTVLATADVVVIEDSESSPDQWEKKSVAVSNLPLGDIDGGSAASNYLPSQIVDGGNASGV